MRACDCTFFQGRRCNAPEAPTSRCLLHDPRVEVCMMFLMRGDRTPEAKEQKQADKKAARAVKWAAEHPPRAFGAVPSVAKTPPGPWPGTAYVPPPPAAPTPSPFEALFKELK